MNNEDILFYWTIATADFKMHMDDEEAHDMLLKWLRNGMLPWGVFSYASMWMEKFKNENNVQRAGVETCMKQ